MTPGLFTPISLLTEKNKNIPGIPASRNYTCFYLNLRHSRVSMITTHYGAWANTLIYGMQCNTDH